jgi:hypothetical protein
MTDEKLRKIIRTLNPDLLDHLDEDSGEIDHPLLRFSVRSPEDAAKVNRIYESKVVRELQALKDRDWSGYISLYEKPHRLNAFVYMMDEYSDQSYWECLAEAWIGTEYPWEKFSEWKACWNSSRPEKQFAMIAAEREALALMPDDLLIYRGTQHDSIDALAWTPRREVALRFARRFSGTGLIMTAAAKKHDVHAFLIRRTEQEIVVDRFSIIDRETLPSEQ